MGKQKQSDEESFLEKLDIFGIGINIRFSQKDEHTTRFGGLITISIAVFMIVQIKLIYRDFFDQSNPTLLYEQNYIQSPGKFSLSSDQFSLAFGLQDLISSQFIDREYFIAQVIQNIEEKTINSTTNQIVIAKSQKLIKIKQCEKSDFQIKETIEFFQQLDLNYLWCIDNSEEIYIEGQEGSDKYVWLQIVIKICDKQNQCNISQYTQNRLMVYYSDNVIVPSKKEHPFLPIGTKIFWNSSIKYSKQLSLLFRDTQIQTDNGFLLIDLMRQNRLKKSQHYDQITELIDNTLYDLSISMEQNFQDVYKRTYLKIDKSFSQIGGTFNILFTIGALLCKPISQLDLNRKLINRIFNFQDQEEQQQDQKTKNDKLKNNSLCKSKEEKVEDRSLIQVGNQQFKFNDQASNFQKYFLQPDSVKEFTCQNEKNTENQQEQNNQNGITPSPIMSLISSVRKSFMMKSSLNSFQKQKSQSFQGKPIPENDSGISITKNKSSLPQSQITQRVDQIDPCEIQKEELDKFFNQQTTTIPYRTWEYFINFFKFSNLCRTRRQKLLQKGVDKLYSRIDIFYLIQKLQEVEKLKYLLLNENQIKLFEFIPKPKLSLKEKKSFSMSDKVGILCPNQKTQEEKINLAVEAFSQIVNNQERISKIDIRIMELLDPKFKNYINQIENFQQPIESKTHQKTNFEINNKLDALIKRRTSIEQSRLKNSFLSHSECLSEQLILQEQDSKKNNLNNYFKQTKLNQIKFKDKFEHE